MSKRFEVFINGKRICVAGMDSYGVLSAVINWVHRDPSAFSEAKKRKLSQDFFSEKISIHVGGRDYSPDFPSGEAFAWAHQELKEGDEISIRILPPGPSDDPIDRNG